MNKAELGRASEGYIPQKRLFSFLFGKSVKPLPLPDERKPYPFYHANLLSQIFFVWLLPVMKTGYNRTVQPEDLWYIDDELQTDKMYQKFKSNLDKRTEKLRNAHLMDIEELRGKGLYNSEEDEGCLFPKHVVLGALWDTFKWEYSFATICSAINNIALTLNPLLAKSLINFVEDKSLGKKMSMGKGVGYSIGSALLIVVAGIVQNHFIHSSMMVGAKSKAVLTKAILEKSFKLNAVSRHNFPAGKIQSIMTTDLARVDLALGYQPIVLAFPILVAISIALLIVNIGVSGLTGVAVLIVTLIILFGSSTKLFTYRKRAVVFTDRRVGYIKELLANMKIIKFYSWESSYLRLIADARFNEMEHILKMQVLRSSLTTLGVTLPQVSSMVSFLVLFAIRGSKNVAEIFSSLSLFNALAQQATNLPIILASGADALSGIYRVRELLECGETDLDEIEEIHKDIEDLVENHIAMRVKDGYFKWQTFGSQDIIDEKMLMQQIERQTTLRTEVTQIDKSLKFSGLRDINIEVKEGEFVVITGLIGTGKTSMLHALSGTMHKDAGLVKVNGSILLCGQPWIQNATFRENIIFGKPFNHEKYMQVIQCCCLTADLDILPLGDLTEIGERGITLSGGQKARLSLARSVYAESDIILFDDVLSAVDAKVGKDIMDLCIMGLLKGKTRVLATHQLSLIGSAERIVFLNGDGTIDVGEFDQLLLRNQKFAELMQFRKSAGEEETDEESLFDLDDKESKAEIISSVEDSDSHIGKVSTVDGRIVEKERRAVNGIKIDVYKKYISLGSGPLRQAFLPLFIFAIVLATFGQIFTNTWLSFWASEKFDRTESFYTGIYIMLTFVSVILVYLEFLLLNTASNRASKLLNLKAVENILRVPMAYVDVTPMGRILNRFTKDTDSLDNELVEQLRLMCYQGANLIGVIILCIIYLPWFAIAVPFLLLIYSAISSFYQASSREIKRVEAVQRSLVFNNFNETLTGMSTIQVYKCEERFLLRNDQLTDQMNEAYFLTIATQRWLGVYLTLISTSIALIITMLAVTGQFSISASSTGLLVSYILQIPTQLTVLIRSMTRVEIDMNSAERLYEYGYELLSEAPLEISEAKPKESWPENGAITFENVSLSYRPELPLALKNISLEIKPNEKIGICGRTGAGKSSIMVALYRLSELKSGRLIIDDIDISKIGLHDLRSKLSIIPQDPVLFKGTIRSNLDPFHDYDDKTLWNALARSGLIEENLIKKVSVQNLQDPNLHKFHLDLPVEDDGVNYSLGEKQLIALARAVVRDTKILVLDEATSSVDYETDSKIQAAIVKEFASCTILCIAHRLNTIIDYDRILVLEKGELAEFDTPWNLFQKKDSIFHEMCEKSKISSDDFNRKP